MKWFIMSDIHGSAYWCEKALERFEAEKCDRILLLGDILYHGPRNPLPDGYEPGRVVEMLSARKNLILCVRGNCEAEVDQMVLPFPVMADYAAVSDGETTVYATHGHRYNADNPLPLVRGDILLSGHTHVPARCEKDGIYYFNPGSVSLPKQQSEHSYMIWEKELFIWKNMRGEKYDEFICAAAAENS